MGLLLAVNGGFMLVATLISLIYKDGVVKEMLLSAIVAGAIGGLVMLGTRNHRKEIKKREGYVIVTFGWIFMSLVGTLPYIFTGAIPSFTNAFFETMSGYTTTGASILTDIESIPKGVLFWRSITHWIGRNGNNCASHSNFTTSWDRRDAAFCCGSTWSRW